MPDIGPIPTYVGSLRSSVRPFPYTRRSGTARSARLTIFTDQLVFHPFGILRGIFHDVTATKYEIAHIYPTTPPFYLNRGYVVFKRRQNWQNPSVSECIYYSPRADTVSDVLNSLEAAGYVVDRTPQKPQLLS